MAAAIPCSRTPQCTYLPFLLSTSNTVISDDFVLLEPDRSADPPTVSVIIGLITFSIISLDLRVATLGCSTLIDFLNLLIALPSVFGTSIEYILENSDCFFNESKAKSLSQDNLSFWPFLPISSHSFFTSVGT